MRTFIRIIVGVAMIGALTLTPTAAFANHGTTSTPTNTPIAGTHEAAPDPPVAPDDLPCVVDGSVETSAHGLPEATVSHGHYVFEEVGMDCPGELGIGPLDVTADGGTDGPDQADGNVPPGTAHGSSNAVAWSNCNGFSNGCSTGHRNRGDISATDASGTCGAGLQNGWVKFVRVGTGVTAWGEVGNCTFYAALQFTPTDPPNHNHIYTLDGLALISD